MAHPRGERPHRRRRGYCRLPPVPRPPRAGDRRQAAPRPRDRSGGRGGPARRPGRLAEAAGILLAHRPPETPCAIARNLGRAGETHRILRLDELEGAGADMLSVVLVGSSRTRLIAGERPRLYTPRGYFD